MTIMIGLTPASPSQHSHASWYKWTALRKFITHLCHSHVAIAWNLLEVHFLVQGNPTMPVAIAT